MFVFAAKSLRKNAPQKARTLALSTRNIILNCRHPLQTKIIGI